MITARVKRADEAAGRASGVGMDSRKLREFLGRVLLDLQIASKVSEVVGRPLRGKIRTNDGIKSTFPHIMFAA